jgi:signal peptidase I
VAVRSKGAPREAKTPGGQLVELIVIVGVALLLAFVIQAVLIKPFRIPSESMEPTLDVNQRVLVDRVSGRFSEPDRGDVVVFKPPAGADSEQCGIPNQPGDGHPCSRPTSDQSEENFIKRIVGGPGDRLKVVRNRVYINGRPLREPYVNPQTACADLCNLPREITIPRDHFFMMGDNRGESADSRQWGPVPEEWIVGNAFFTYWPPRKVGLF